MRLKAGSWNWSNLTLSAPCELTVSAICYALAELAGETIAGPMTIGGPENVT